MGACASSSHRDSGSAMKLGVTFRSKLDKLSSISPSPLIQKAATNVDRSITDQLSPARDYGSKEDAFFDSKPWLDSDCEDDFYSVNGDSTPSRGSTPVHHNFSHVNKNPFENRSPVCIPSPSSIEKKTKLADLFREIYNDGDDINDAKDTSSDQTMTNEKMEMKPAAQDILSKSVNGTPYVLGSERTANEDLIDNKQKKSTQCCIPTFVSFRISSQRRKMSPSYAVAGQV